MTKLFFRVVGEQLPATLHGSPNIRAFLGWWSPALTVTGSCQAVYCTTMPPGCLVLGSIWPSSAFYYLELYQEGSPSERYPCNWFREGVCSSRPPKRRMTVRGFGVDIQCSTPGRSGLITSSLQE